MGRVIRRPGVGILAASILVLLSVAPVVAADPVTFGAGTAEGSFGEDVVFRQDLTLAEVPSRVELLLTFPGSSGSTVVTVPSPRDTGDQTVVHRLPTTGEAHLMPNTVIGYRWRVDGVLGPAATFRYLDDRFDWQTEAGSIVRVHWYEGDAAFGRRALRIGEDAVAASSDLLGVTETEPVDFYIYARRTDFYDALGPATRENVGGQADSATRTLYALITPGEIDDPWVGVVIPHELQHLVFNTAVDNPYHFPPRWLNEGLAVYVSEGYPSDHRRDVERAAADGTLIPLTGLTGQFPTGDGFGLAYAESSSAVDYLIRTYGQDTLVGLVRSYAEGRTDDEAFTQAIGIGMRAFSDAWLADLDAVTPTRYGPQAAAPGPTPTEWLGSAAPSLPPVDPSARPAATPTPTPAPSGSRPVVGTDGGDASGVGSLVALALFAVGLVIVIVVWRRGRSRRGVP